LDGYFAFDKYSRERLSSVILVALSEVAIHKVTKEIHFCYGHRLLNYNGKCRYLHGHNGRAEIEVSSQALDSRGMVVDFGDITQIVKAWIDRVLDHRMLLCKDDPLAQVLSDQGEPCFLMDSNPTAENIAKLIYEYARSEGLEVTEVRLWETATSFATYRSEPAE
jgi:6-pyruvoyltetrahydropterin/6-carboxytetrahydropterin synthase